MQLWIFCFPKAALKTTARHSAPLFITIAALSLVCAVFLFGEATKDRPEGKFRLDIFDKLESITYDARVRMAASIPDDTQHGKSLATRMPEKLSAPCSSTMMRLSAQVKASIAP